MDARSSKLRHLPHLNANAMLDADADADAALAKLLPWRGGGYMHQEDIKQSTSSSWTYSVQIPRGP